MCKCNFFKKCSCDKKIFTKDINYDGIVASCLDPTNTLCPPYSSFNSYLELLGSKLCELIAMGGIPGPAGPAGADGTNGTNGLDGTMCVNINFDITEEAIGGGTNLTISTVDVAFSYIYSWAIKSNSNGHSISTAASAPINDIAVLTNLGLYTVVTREDALTYQLRETLFEIKAIQLDPITLLPTGCIYSTNYLLKTYTLI